MKVEALLRFASLPYRWLPRQGRFPEALRFEWRRRRLVSGALPLTWPRMTDLDEFPLVPFLFGPRGENLYDSSAIAQWIDENALAPEARSTPLLPVDAALRMAVRLVDEALDEVGLYLVHHNRWVLSARDNDAGARLATEMRPLLGPLTAILRRNFPIRQARRLPYLFSVADAAERDFDDLPQGLRPPSRQGFPPTHGLLDQLFWELLSAVEPVFVTRPFLFGGRMTLADASLYGQLGMNRTDPSANDLIRQRAPATYAWIERLDRGEFAPAPAPGELVLDELLDPLLAWVCRAFVPLMQQNLAAYERYRSAGVARFNEAAFDRGDALYDGELAGHPFRSVAKSFQVPVWRDLRRDWTELSVEARNRLETRLPEEHGLDRDR